MGKDSRQSVQPSLSWDAAMIGLIELVLLCGGVSAGSHSLRFFFTSMTPIPGLPDFFSVGYVDEAQIDYYDSNLQKATFRQRWMSESPGPDFWQEQTQRLRIWEQTAKAQIQTLMKRNNQSAGIHILQTVYGCELREDGSTWGFYQDGWDGKDAIVLDKENMMWVAVTPFMVLTKQEWDRDTARNQRWKDYLEQECIAWLNEFLKLGENELRPVAPHLFPSVDKVSATKPTQFSCLVTGFYPRDIEVTLLRNGRSMADTESHDILPNHDGTYQLRKWAQIDPNDGATYSCQYEQSGKEGVKIRDWDGTFRDTPGSPEGTNLGLIVGIVVAAVAVIALVIGAVVWKRREPAGESGKWSRGTPSTEISEFTSTHLHSIVSQHQ
ncbi:major histocompatibility complex class I-related gene protein-like isoform X2 [Heterodontus francisci]|uniref:major histocompatibility complex class I-related gene protein-like isoform X2 n=1 Tax=Heterodontus francisci TaxID=7792 RepID=UPI00355B4234